MATDTGTCGGHKGRTMVRTFEWGKKITILNRSMKASIAMFDFYGGSSWPRPRGEDRRTGWDPRHCLILLRSHPRLGVAAGVKLDGDLN